MEYILKDFGKQLKKNHLEMRRYFTPRGTDCYRVYDKNIGELPVTVDIYGSFVHILDYRDDTGIGGITEETIIDVVSRMLYFEKDRIVYKTRTQRSGGLQHGKLSDSGDFFTVRENGLGFLVNLVDYIDTGLFLDHRRTREMVMESSEGKAVLNLFGYTGSFSVYAAAGGAKIVDTVDLSGNYLKWARRNVELNNLSGENIRFYSEDVLKFLFEAGKNKKKYDIIVLDPPTFSNSRKMEGTFDIQRDYVSVLNKCISLLNTGGAVFFSTNYKKFHFDPGRINGGVSRDITSSTIDRDFSRKRKPHRCWVIEKRSKK